ncbi:hypothetical protein I4641_13780 [Waterburya agarophytonicola K14]|uniref:DUF6876 domain-containing protein n=1 Tax=Waterburya agarophytonicola KI4 TaxID=2874699 RepID=A0A964BRD8_9CYAN|nr:DUF6876 family protein [Waterburya agarophytonicola]MCC0178050.1 hypothetical protein [Waterburya agarophytonicola KI4]
MSLEEDLRQFMGTTGYFRPQPLLFPKFLLTDGARYVAEKAEAFWLFDAIASLQLHPKIKNHRELKDLQFWRLEVAENKSAMLSVEWDEDRVVYTQGIGHTTFPLKSLLLYVAPTVIEVEKKDRIVKVCYLPSEH